MVATDKLFARSIPSSASARRRSELRLNADCGGTRLARLRDTM
jgi:hypothetical protein